jgi:hypothetical protein
MALSSKFSTTDKEEEEEEEKVVAVIWTNMNFETRGHYVKWSKQDTERQTLYDVTPLWNFKVSLKEVENGIVITAG